MNGIDLEDNSKVEFKTKTNCNDSLLVMFFFFKYNFVCVCVLGGWCPHFWPHPTLMSVTG